jgi:glutathione S-transferase
VTGFPQNLEGKTFVVGEEFTAADIFMGQTLSVVDSFAGLLSDAYPNTKAYHKRILERPAAVKAYSP